MNAQLSAHRIVNVRVERKEFESQSGFSTIDLIATDEDGDTVTLTLYSDSQIAIDDSFPILHVTDEELEEA